MSTRHLPYPPDFEIDHTAAHHEERRRRALQVPRRRRRAGPVDDLIARSPTPPSTRFPGGQLAAGSSGPRRWRRLLAAVAGPGGPGHRAADRGPPAGGGLGHGAEWGPRRRPEAPTVAPTTLTEIARRYYACAVALAKAMGLPMSETFLRDAPASPSRAASSNREKRGSGSRRRSSSHRWSSTRRSQCLTIIWRHRTLRSQRPRPTARRPRRPSPAADLPTRVPAGLPCAGQAIDALEARGAAHAVRQGGLEGAGGQEPGAAARGALGRAGQAVGGRQTSGGQRQWRLAAAAGGTVNCAGRSCGATCRSGCGMGCAGNTCRVGRMPGARAALQ